VRPNSPVAPAPASITNSPGAVVGIDELRFRSSSASRTGGILFVLAHPDDETFLCGGTIARYAAAGMAVLVRDYRTEPRSQARWVGGIAALCVALFILGAATLTYSALDPS